MILEILDGRVHLEGWPLDAPASFCLVPRQCNEYRLEPGDPAVREDGQYVRVDAARSTLTVQTSWHGEFPLFHHAGPGYVAISSSFEPLLAGLARRRGAAPALDRVGILESMIFDHPLRSRTLFADVRKIATGRRLTFDWATGGLSEETVHVLPYDSGAPPPRAAALLDQAVGVLSGLVREAPPGDGAVLLPLSGGLDSRLLGCLLQRSGVPFDAVTFGPPESTDPFIARRVAKRLGIALRHLELKDAYYLPYGDELAWRTGGLSGHRHCHLYACLAEHGVRADRLVHGYLGDVYAGASQPASAARYAMTREEALRDFRARHVEKTWLWRRLPATDREAIGADLEAILDECCRRNLPCHFEEYAHSVDRQYGLIANIFSPVERFATVVRPFASRAYAEFFNALPHRWRADRRLFRDACAALFPAAFAIGNQDELLGDRSRLGWLEEGLSTAITLVCYASLLGTGGRWVLRNPKAFERHRELLVTALCREFADAIADVSEVLALDLRPLRSVGPRNRHELDSQYRILSLHALRKGLAAHGLAGAPR